MKKSSKEEESQKMSLSNILPHEKTDSTNIGTNYIGFSINFANKNCLEIIYNNILERNQTALLTELFFILKLVVLLSSLKFGFFKLSRSSLMQNNSIELTTALEWEYNDHSLKTCVSRAYYISSNIDSWF